MIYRDRLLEDGYVIANFGGIDFDEAIAVINRDLGTVSYGEVERFAPRVDHGEFIYSAYDWPSDESICLRSELTYSQNAPDVLVYHLPSSEADSITFRVADNRRMLEIVSEDVLGRLDREGWILERTFGQGFGISYEEAFRVGSAAGVAEYCGSNEISYEWHSDSRLATSQKRNAVINHPILNESCWFNQAAFLSKWSLDSDVLEYIQQLVGEENLPFRTKFGGGDIFPKGFVDHVNESYDEIGRDIPLKRGEFLIMDNLLCAHGHAPYGNAGSALVTMLTYAR